MFPVVQTLLTTLLRLKELLSFWLSGGSNMPNNNQTESDIVIVGAGFAGITALYRLRKLGFKCRVLEKGSDIGGIWHWICYPGARVDSYVPSYEFSMPECWQDWEWTNNYPDYAEMRRYFDHCDEKLSIRQHVSFSTTVTGARYDESSNTWTVECNNGQSVRCKYLVLAVGFTSDKERFTHPDTHLFEGDVYYPYRWPEDGVEPDDKRVAIVGSGSTSVQIVQEWASKAKSLTVFQRTPNTAIPVHPKPFSPGEYTTLKSKYPTILETRKTSPSGLADAEPIARRTFDDPLDKQQRTYENLYQHGGLPFWVSSYKDMMHDEAANRQAYDFWVRKTRSRIISPRKRELLAPLQPPHPFGAKRPPLEQNYFEQFNRENVDVIDAKATPISTFTSDGIITSDNTVHHADILVFATGFKSVITALTSLGVQGIDGLRLEDLWAEGLLTYLGIMCHGFPNMFILDGPQAPSEMGNAPTNLEVQGDWIATVVEKMKSGSVDAVHPTVAAMEEWRDKVRTVTKRSLYRKAESRYMTSHAVEDELEPLYFGGGIPKYVEELNVSLTRWREAFIMKSSIQ